jgi:undecaprenyl-diphosphatase
MVIALGFVVAFLVAMVVIRWLIAYVSTNDFTPFGWYRIVVGLVGGAWLLLK